jgi:hypothetical protein
MVTAQRGGRVADREKVTSLPPSIFGRDRASGAWPAAVLVCRGLYDEDFRYFGRNKFRFRPLPVFIRPNVATGLIRSNLEKSIQCEPGEHGSGEKGYRLVPNARADTFAQAALARPSVALFWPGCSVRVTSRHRTARITLVRGHPVRPGRLVHRLGAVLLLCHSFGTVCHF